MQFIGVCVHANLLNEQAQSPLLKQRKVEIFYFFGMLPVGLKPLLVRTLATSTGWNHT
jgi:hypothetical protein